MGIVKRFNHPIFNKEFGSALCLPHLIQKGWMYRRRVYHDNGNWLTQPNGITLPLAEVNDLSARANLGIKLAYKSSQGNWDYYLEFVRPLNWNQAFNDPYLLIRRMLTISGDGETAAILGYISLPSAMQVSAEFIEPLGNIRFQVERFDAGGRIVRVIAKKL